jgi:hypothetical protein
MGDEAGRAVMNLAKILLDEGISAPKVSCALITVGVSVADAAGGKAEAIHMLHEHLADLKAEAN